METSTKAEFAVYVIYKRFCFGCLKFQNFLQRFLIFTRSTRAKNRLLGEDGRTERYRETTQKGNGEKPVTSPCVACQLVWQLVSMVGSAKCVSHERLLTHSTFDCYYSIPQRPFYVPFHIIDSYGVIHCHLPFIATHFGMTLFPYKSLSHKLNHFYPVSQGVLVYIFPNLIQLLYYCCISSHGLSITNPCNTKVSQDLPVKSLRSHMLTALVRKLSISSGRNLTPTQSSLKTTLFAHITKKGRGIAGEKWNRDLDTATLCPFLLCFSACEFRSLLLLKDFSPWGEHM